jgi:hypothetical protein
MQEWISPGAEKKIRVIAEHLRGGAQVFDVVWPSPPNGGNQQPGSGRILASDKKQRIRSDGKRMETTESIPKLCLARGLNKSTVEDNSIARTQEFHILAWQT